LSANQDFRNAVKYGLDYAGLLSLAGKGAIRDPGFIPVGSLGALPPADATQRDLATAKADLAKVGVANPTITLTYPSDLSTDGVVASTFATKIQADLGEVGITVKLAAQPVSVLLPAWMAGKLQMLLIVNSADYSDPSDFTFWTPGGYVAGWFGWKAGMDPQIDTLVATANSAVQPVDRDAAFKALGTAINAKAYGDWILQPGRVLVEAKSIHATVNVFTAVDLASIT
jgi:peptide/nickel transport system substrate-binding protein